jgi:hypothetical protein
VADGPATASIPESALVALAAIQDAHPDWLRDPGRLSSRASDPIMQTLLSDPAAELARVSVHVGAFVKAAAGISIR